MAYIENPAILPLGAPPSSDWTGVPNGMAQRLNEEDAPSDLFVYAGAVVCWQFAGGILLCTLWLPPRYLSDSFVSTTFRTSDAAVQLFDSQISLHRPYQKGWV